MLSIPPTLIDLQETHLYTHTQENMVILLVNLGKTLYAHQSDHEHQLGVLMLWLEGEIIDD